MTCKNLNELFSKLEQDVNEILNEEVAEAVKEELSESVQTAVYDVYSPLYYKRREYTGGLIDQRNMKHTVENNTLTVTNETPLDNGMNYPYSLTEIVVNGYGNQPAPRDFIEDCKERLKENKSHIKAFEKGMKKKGYNFK